MILELKAWMQKLIVRSKTHRNIVYAVMSHVKFQSPKKIET